MRIEALTIFRYIAALIIVIFHFGKEASIVKFAPGFFISGQEMVTFFFVLSGFVMMLGYYSKSNFSSKQFWKNRAIRILPGYFIALVIMLFFIQPNATNEILGVVFSFLLLQAWVPPFPVFFNGPGWAVSVEAVFYFLFPTFYKDFKRTNTDPKKILFFSIIFWLATQIILILLLNSQIYTNNPSQIRELIFYFPLLHLCSFVLGLAGGYLLLKYKNKFNFSKFFSYSFFFATIIIIFWLLQNKGIFNFFGIAVPSGSSFLAPIFLIFIFSIVTLKDTFIEKILSIKPLVALGKSSYAFYIFQYPIYAVTFKYIFSSTDNLNNNLKFYSFIFILTLFSLGFTYFIQNPISKYIKNKTKKISPQI